MVRLIESTEYLEKAVNKIKKKETNQFKSDGMNQIGWNEIDFDQNGS